MPAPRDNRAIVARVSLRTQRYRAVALDRLAYALLDQDRSRLSLEQIFPGERPSASDLRWLTSVYSALTGEGLVRSKRTRSGLRYGLTTKGWREVYPRFTLRAETKHRAAARRALSSAGNSYEAGSA